MAKISGLLSEGKVVSVELWPPRTEAAEVRLESALEELESAVRPSFYSITYGAGGSTRERTHELVVRLQASAAESSMAHLVCAAHSRQELSEILQLYSDAGVENILCLKGDPPLGAGAAISPGELGYASELVELAKETGDFCVAVAAHPEGHSSSPDIETDRRWLAAKLEVADFAITQFFFDPTDYLRLVDDLSRLGCEKPILPGVMSVTNPRTLKKMAEMSGCRIPLELDERIERASGDLEEVRRIGVETATKLCDELISLGAPGLHFFTMNLAAATIEVCANLGLVGSARPR